MLSDIASDMLPATSVNQTYTVCVPTADSKFSEILSVYVFSAASADATEVNDPIFGCIELCKPM